MASSYSNYKMFKCFTRKFKITEVEPPLDVQEAFAKYSRSGAYMTVAQFRQFLVDYQGEVDMTVFDAQPIMEQVLSRTENNGEVASGNSKQGHGKGQGQEQGQGPRFDIDDFFHFLFLDDLNGPISSEVHHDMTAPLSHYFIYTGHNSYLTGNQLSSDCSDAPIIKALQRGVRVIELDMWPNSSKTDILILHGRTLTSPVTLVKCLRSIKEYAFVKSPYPVIITLEDHLTPKLQAKVAEMVSEIFGDMLYYPTEGSLVEFPSPEQLKYRIIISTKPPKEYQESEGSLDKSILLQSDRDSSDEDTPQKDKPEAKVVLECDDKIEVDEDSDEGNPNESNPRSSQPGALDYKRLITINAGKPKGNLKDALQIVDDVVKRLSLSEQELEKVVSSNGADVVRFTQKNILRVYPKGTRVTSSNYNAHLGWMHGAQMVAFNMQGYGKSLWKMHGVFRANGGCGYVKKPKFLMERGPRKEVFDPKKELPVKKTLKVKVYMGDGWTKDFSRTHFDTFSPPDFYTKLQIVGVPADAAKKKTKVIENNWFPVWNEEFTFALTVPELALLRLEVREHDRSEKDDFGGQTCLPISELRSGIRSVPLYDKKGDKYKSVKLLMRFRIV